MARIKVFDTTTQSWVYADKSFGKDGVSPTVDVSKSGKVTTVSITDKNGTKTATINDGSDGSNGKDGSNGVSATHSWNGTTLTVTSASGTSSADLKGATGAQGYSFTTSVSRPSFAEEKWTLYGEVGHSETWSETDSIRNGCRIGDIFTVVGTATDTKHAHVAYYRCETASGNLRGTCIAHSIAERGATGATGATGAAGATGTSVTVKSVSESTADGGSNVVTFSDGKTVTIKNGEAGTPGKTPVRGTDYWTPADQESMVQDVIAALGTPVFGRVDAEKNIILSTSGVLADGTYKLWFEGKDGKLSEVCTYDHSNEPEVTYTNLFDPATASLNTRMSGTSKTPKSENGYVMTAAIPVPAGTTMTGTYDESTPYIAVPAAMWTKSASMIGYRSDGIEQYDGFVSVEGGSTTVVGAWAKIPIYTQWGGTVPIKSVTVSLYVKGSAITASDIQNIEIYFNEIPE